MSKLTQKNKSENNSNANETSKKNDSVMNFEKDTTKAKDIEFFKFDSVGVEFIGKFLEKFTDEKTTSNPNGLEGLLFADLEGNNFLLPNYYKLNQYIDEKTEEGTDFDKTVFKITLSKITESAKGKLYLFDFAKASI